MKPAISTLFLLGVFLVPLQAGIIRVPADAPSIQAGIDSAARGDTVLIAEGTYFENIHFKGKRITVASHFILDGDSTHISQTVIDGSQPTNADSGSVVYFLNGEDTTAVLSGLTITGGTGTITRPVFAPSARAGGGIYCINSGPKISHNRIINNAIADPNESIGGGMHIFLNFSFYRPTIENNIIHGNSLDGDSLAVGGGLFANRDAIVRGNLISENTCSSRYVSIGGGVEASGVETNIGTATLLNNVIRDNQLISGYVCIGGGVDTGLADLNISGNSITGNIVEGAFYNVGAGMHIQFAEGGRVLDNVFQGNTQMGNEGEGGGLHVELSAGVSIQGNRYENNSATYGGGVLAFEADVVLRRNLIARNQADIGGGVMVVFSLFASNNAARQAAQLADFRRQLGTGSIKNALLRSTFATDTINRFQFINNTVAHNYSANSGGGLHASGSGPLVSNSIFWGNEAFANPQLEGPAIVTYSLLQGGRDGTGNIDIDPAFEDTLDYHLSLQSPAIDAGNPDPAFNDKEDPASMGSPLWPALGSLRNDMGTYGGNGEAILEDDLLGPQFRAFVERVNAVPSGERTAIVDSFMNAAASFPFVEADNIVYFIYRGNANRVNVPGDANGWSQDAFPMQRLADTDLWYREGVFETDARLDYKFVLNAATWILDPRNPHEVLGGFGPNSELAMPDYVQPDEIEFDTGIPHGTLHDTTLTSSILGNTRRIRIYTPHNYEASPDERFPVALFHDGLEYITLAQADNVLDNLIAADLIVPIIAVFVPPVDRDNEYAFNRTQSFEDFIIEEVMPMVDSKYRTQMDPRSRAMAGISFGGLISTQICYNQPDKFGLCAPYSPAYWPNNKAILNSVMSGETRDIKWYLDWGTYEVDILLDGRTFRDHLLVQGSEITWSEWHEGHSWGSWRAHLDIALQYFFSPSVVGVEENPELPAEFRLMQNYPNPFNPGTSITYALRQRSDVKLEIFNLLGQRVRTLVDANQPAGTFHVVWDGKDDSGRQATSGLYVYRLRAGQFEQAKTLVLLR